MFRAASENFVAVQKNGLRLLPPAAADAERHDACFKAATAYAEAVNQWSAAEDAAAIGTAMAPMLAKMLTSCVACGTDAAVAAAAVDDVAMRATASDAFCASCFSAAAHSLLSEASAPGSPACPVRCGGGTTESDDDEDDAKEAAMEPAETISLLAAMVQAGELPHLFLHRVRSPARWIGCGDGDDVRTFSIGLAEPPAGALAPASVLPQLLAMDAASHALSGIVLVMSRRHDRAAPGPQLESTIACIRVASVLLLPPAYDVADEPASVSLVVAPTDDDDAAAAARRTQWVTVVGVSDAVREAFATVNGRGIALCGGPITAPCAAAAGTVRGVLAHGLLKAAGFLRSGVPPGGFEVNREIAIRLVAASSGDTG